LEIKEITCVALVTRKCSRQNWSHDVPEYAIGAEYKDA
jgi:hypothetical protein